MTFLNINVVQYLVINSKDVNFKDFEVYEWPSQEVEGNLHSHSKAR